MDKFYFTYLNECFSFLTFNHQSSIFTHFIKYFLLDKYLFQKKKKTDNNNVKI